MSNIVIYGLQDPRDGAIWYVGKTNSPELRLQHHLDDKQTNAGRVRWIDGLQQAGLEPRMLVLERVPEQDWQDAERHWIDTGKRRGWPLLNIREGGIGGEGEEDWSYMLGYLGPDLYRKFERLPIRARNDVVMATARAMGTLYLPWYEAKQRGEPVVGRSQINWLMMGAAVETAARVVAERKD